MLKILIIIFESSFGHNILYISNNYALHSMDIDGVKNETLFDLNTKKRYINIEGKFEEYVRDSKLSELINVDGSEEYTQSITFMGYKSCEITRTISKNNYDGKFRNVYSLIPIIDDFVEDESKKLFIPGMVVINSQILLRTFMAESHNGVFDENAIILEKLESIDTIEVESDFFVKLLNK